MKTKLLTICLFLVTSQVFASDWEYGKEVDEFNGATTQILFKTQNYPKKNSNSTIQLFKSDKEVKEITVGFGVTLFEDRQTTYYLYIKTKSESWNILGAKEALVLLDGERWNKHEVSIPVGDIDTDTSDFFISESHAIVYNKKDFKKLLKAKTFKARVGSLIYSINLSKVDFRKLQL